MNTNEALKLNKKIGDDYLLYPTNDGWILMRDGSFRVIMDSTRNTREELDKFIEEHKIYNPIIVFDIFCMIFSQIFLASIILNMFFLHSRAVTFFNLGATLILLFITILNFIVSERNNKLKQKTVDEDMTYLMKISSEVEKEEKSTKATVRKRKTRVSSEIQK